MTKSRFTQIGLDRLIRIAWLKRTASLALSGKEPSSIKSILQKELQAAFRSTNVEVRGSIDKTLTILMRIWLTPPRDLDTLRIEGLHLLNRMPQRDQLVVHWGMIMAVYPFWASVATQVGRLLRLQGSVAAVHVQRRVREQYGERETVSRRTRYALRSYVEWGVLEETSTKGTYAAAPLITVSDPQVISWLIEALLHTRANGSGAITDLLASPAFFPFQLSSVSADQLLSTSRRVEVLRHGMDENLVMLRPGGQNSTEKRGS